jgi:hypothetical protein
VIFDTSEVKQFISKKREVIEFIGWGYADYFKHIFLIIIVI